MKLRRFFALLVSHAFLVFGMLGILTSMAAFTVNSQPAMAATPAFVRIIHASPAIGSADVFVDGAPLLTSFQFGSVTDYVSVPPGAHKVQIALVGKGINAAVITQTLDVSPGVVYTVAATGAQATSASLKVFIDNNQLASGLSKVRVYQLSPDSGPLSVTIPSKTLVANLPYQGASTYFSTTPGAYQFEVTAPTSNVNHSLQTTLVANKITSIFAVGLFNGTPSFELISALVDGVPGLPNTGSDPNPPAVQSGGPLPAMWLIGLLATVFLLFLSGWGYMRLLASKLR
ncbi:MAG TPA: DUF4397 domain-containing protein [Ktedonobacteraceae bacterium]|jgi:hypothetical protein